MSKLIRPQPTVLHNWLDSLIGPEVHCYCEDPGDRRLGLRGSHPPSIICESCWKVLRVVPEDQWTILQNRIRTTQHYTEATWRLRIYQQHHSDREVFMVKETVPGSEPLPPNLLRTIPGHIVFKTPEKAADGSNCAHRWIITENNQVKCILCEGVRQLTVEELKIIESSEAAGVVFLKWPERLAVMERAKGSKRRRRKKSKGGGSRGVQTGDRVPEGFMDVKTAAAQLGTDPKRLRKKIRSGLYEGVKVGGRVYVKLEMSE